MGDYSVAVRKLEFDKIVRRLSHLTQTDPGKSLAESLAPTNNTSEIRHQLQMVSEMKALLIAEGAIPLDGVKSISAHLKECAVENQYLGPEELLDVEAVLRASRHIKSLLGKRRQSHPALATFIDRLVSEKVVEYNIREAIEEGGKVRDSASKELRMIRADMIALGLDLRKRLTSILRRVAEQEYTQEDIITTRDGRFVIPVKTEFKHRVPGFIHSTSASGATVFIEPAETLDLNNALRELQFREEREIERILRELTKQIRELKDPLSDAAANLAMIDLLSAKARYSIEVLGNAPQLTDNPVLRLKDARHPILIQRHRREDVIPLDVELGANGIRTLIITGPNAGGKSVTMTCVGLSCLCVQAGLHIPASADSEFFVFDNIFVDIGDNQSLDNDLSTFSSHLMNLSEILSRSDDKSLVLIDEIGAGTDPAEGGALAAAALEALTSRGTLTIATTHHGALKAFAHETPGCANASLEFDPQSLKPTYRFRFGIPGSSYALELAERMGLDRSLLERARSTLGTEKTRLESLLLTLEQQVHEYREKLRRLSEDRDRLDVMVHAYEQKIAEVQKEIRSLRQKASEEARDLVRQAQSTIERLVKEIRESSAAPQTIRSAKEEIQRNLEFHSPPGDETDQDLELKVGDLVTVQDGTEPGEIVALRGAEATVVWKSGTLRIPVRTLRKVSRRTSTVTDTRESYARREVQNELDLRGLTGDEAVAQVQRFLDEAFAAGLHRVDLIHGKGTGALRKKIAQFLSEYPHIKDFRLGEWNEGGTGVTVVELSDE